ncbi:excinuclease ABC subunit B [Candidatus Berkelbacteria bacterium CG_4_9_14_3_um_filter_39_23]|uniref:UvrABC system protein B n=1 Tax=Candidatus Berkelbacteria bacterium CG_4_9_14_3_um_filter_39_23 TaxID=1974508 RepID=A0A2M8C459_9BACT|nr:MAG: excinuclease ABC subunit B [Candidatus Berkelbacteria bacterium CG2_30_39_44]PIZ28998.1 MAG: excinuclease ABC subunit B [Candidatus Berkelbacteria bacterium CG_4_10_14_0_8_um_filter_39_42]PJB50888.1 MAG: excinuclease ABC subunit B [Candidatus Berkelbacteria bacterium CG_4_9_14_3_um_filter_39_23]
MKFKLHSNFKPSGDQPEAIKKLVQGIKSGKKHQTLLGVTGSGKTFTIANVIEKIQKPTLVIAHNKTLAAQLTQEYRQFFPRSAVEYFVSYYDYYQPEAYVPSTDSYIEKESQINEEIDRLRHSATQALLSRQDVIVVASVSCIYNIGSPEIYEKTILWLATGMPFGREKAIAKLVAMQYTRRQHDLLRGTFRIIGAMLEIQSPSAENLFRVYTKNGLVDRILEIKLVSRQVVKELSQVVIFPAKHYLTEKENLEKALQQIQIECDRQVSKFKQQAKLLEADRLERRTKYDLEMIREVGYCNGIENYSRYFDGRKPGDPAHTLIDYFPPDFLLIIDESHVCVPQIGAMYAGDKSRKQTLIEHGFRLPSALDNRPLNFQEFEKKMPQTIYTTATPSEYEIKKSTQIVEQIVRPTGLIDPQVLIRPTDNQIENLCSEIEKRIAKQQRVLVTTLTKKQAEDLTDYLKEKKLAVEYLHSGVKTLERIEKLTKLRRGEVDIIVGVNLLREGLDLPEVSLVAILDADKEGFLRSQTSLIQTIGRAARNTDGTVILYADKITGSMKRAIDETTRRRKKQILYNKKNRITPQTIQKNIEDITKGLIKDTGQKAKKLLSLEQFVLFDNQQIEKTILAKQAEMKIASRDLDFELAILLRDEIQELEKMGRQGGNSNESTVGYKRNI